MKEKFLGKISLCMPHALIVGHCPDKLTMEQIANKQALERNDISSLGLFEVTAPNFNNYYPDVSAEDLNPDLDKESFIYPVYRALSEVTVHKQYNPIDFAQNGVLKQAMSMLQGQTVYANHEMVVGNELGVIQEVYWQEAYTTNSGVKVPAGANVKLKIDGKSNPKIARGMMMTPPSIHSVSVTVSFEWEPSHEFEDPNTFWRRLGETHEDGTQIRRIVTGIKNFHEISTVHHGADPFAQRIGEDGNIALPEYAERVSNSTVENTGRAPWFSYDYTTDVVRNAQLDETTLKKSNNKNTQKDERQMNKHLLSLCALFSIATDELSEEQMGEKLTAKIKDLQTQELWDEEKANGMVENAVKPLKEKITELEGQVETFKNAEEQSVEKLKGEVVTVLNKLHNNKPAEALVTSLDNQNKEGLTALLQSYTEQLEEKYPLHCESCGSDSVARRSSASNGEEGGEGESGKGATNDIQKSIAAFQKGSHKDANTMFDNSSK